ncbi:MAG: hypothetical protein M1834_005895 [Cirrosporium novae-zelandiae]|nr:MAG: hypothetical protein M1834_005895 [Cirrosporium novae-zelandiae]
MPPQPLILPSTTTDVFTQTRSHPPSPKLKNKPSLASSISPKWYSCTRLAAAPPSDNDNDHDDKDNENDNENERRLDIFTTSHELPFTGHPTIGTAIYVLKNEEEPFLFLLLLLLLPHKTKTTFRNKSQPPLPVYPTIQKKPDLASISRNSTRFSTNTHSLTGVFWKRDFEIGS